METGVVLPLPVEKPSSWLASKCRERYNVYTKDSYRKHGLAQSLAFGSILQLHFAVFCLCQGFRYAPNRGSKNQPMPAACTRALSWGGERLGVEGQCPGLGSGGGPTSGPALSGGYERGGSAR
jgi:hypothetical protein